MQATNKQLCPPKIMLLSYYDHDIFNSSLSKYRFNQAKSPVERPSDDVENKVKTKVFNDNLHNLILN
jgi:hypothetical protein